MKIEDGIDMLELPIFLLGTDRTIYPTLIHDNENVILVDAGISDSLKDIKIIPNEIPEVKVFVHEEDKPNKQGEKKILRLNSKFMDRINSLPNEEQKKVLDMFDNSSVKVNITLNDGEELINSLKKLEKYNTENVISYHGGLFSNKPNERIKDLIKG